MPEERRLLLRLRVVNCCLGISGALKYKFPWKNQKKRQRKNKQTNIPTFLCLFEHLALLKITPEVSRVLMPPC